ncbi:MAG TPA: translation initiation factor IF-3 [Polyangiaceae bacterium]|nr:translation initiation factor IF-3 [Polyangiaceae bacterium]
MRRRFRSEPRAPQIRVNHRIRVPEVLVVMEDGTNLGVITTQEALRRARELGLDLVEINPKGNPPVCKILDFGKFKYEESRQKRETKRKQTVIEIKEIKLRPKTDDHDLDVKLRAARKFLETGNKVKVVCRFRGREITHPEIARQQLDHLVKGTTDIAQVELAPNMEGRAMTLMLAPKSVILQRVAQDKTRREQERLQEREADRKLSAEEREARRLRQIEAEAERRANKKSIDELDDDQDDDDDDDEYDDDEHDDDDLDDEDDDGEDGDDEDGDDDES